MAQLVTTETWRWLMRMCAETANLKAPCEGWQQGGCVGSFMGWWSKWYSQDSVIYTLYLMWECFFVVFCCLCRVTVVQESRTRGSSWVQRAVTSLCCFPLQVGHFGGWFDHFGTSCAEFFFFFFCTCTHKNHIHNLWPRFLWHHLMLMQLAVTCLVTSFLSTLHPLSLPSTPAVKLWYQCISVLSCLVYLFFLLWKSCCWGF